MLKGERRIKAIERDIGRQVVGRAWINVIEKARGREMSRKEFNKIVNRSIRMSREDSDQILDVFKSSRKVKVTQRRIRLL